MTTHHKHAKANHVTHACPAVPTKPVVLVPVPAHTAPPASAVMVDWVVIAAVIAAYSAYRLGSKAAGKFVSLIKARI